MLVRLSVRALIYGLFGIFHEIVGSILHKNYGRGCTGKWGFSFFLTSMRTMSM